MGRERRGCVRSRSQLVVYYPRPGTGGHQLTFWCCRISQSQSASPTARFRILACMIDLRDSCCLADLIKLLPACPAAWHCHARQPYKLYDPYVQLSQIRRSVKSIDQSNPSILATYSRSAFHATLPPTRSPTPCRSMSCNGERIGIAAYKLAL